MKNFLGDKAAAWQVLVRRTNSLKAFALYSTYDSLKQAKATVKAIEGDPIEARLVPLYPAITNEDLK